jgi:S1-C subfamily serine protease
MSCRIVEMDGGNGVADQQPVWCGDEICELRLSRAGGHVVQQLGSTKRFPSGMAPSPALIWPEPMPHAGHADSCEEVSMNWMRARVLVPIAIVGSLFMCNGQDMATATFDRILPTLALIIGRMPNSTSSGTGFCIWSNASKSYFLTNQHVIEGAREVLLRLQAFELPLSKALVKGRAARVPVFGVRHA